MGTDVINNEIIEGRKKQSGLIEFNAIVVLHCVALTNFNIYLFLLSSELFFFFFGKMCLVQTSCEHNTNIML